ncbi:MAG: hypothetical protein V3S55_08475 [Nitrospiraceae bacterium]
MQRNFLRFVRVACLSVITLVLLGGGIAEAQQDLNKLLNKQYGTTFFRSCSQNTAGFGAANDLLSDGSTRETAIHGTRTYNGDGTGTVLNFPLNVFDNEATGETAASRSQTNCTLTYVVNPDLSFTENLTCAGTILSGPSATDTFTITGVVIQGQMSPNRHILLYSDTDDNVETLTLEPGTRVRLRICGRSGTGVRLK